MFTPTDTSPSESKSESSPFEIIYQAAKEENKDKILTVLQDYSIDVYCKKLNHVPASLLAAENNKPALDFLIKHFNPSVSWIMYGIAMRSDKAEAYIYLQKISLEMPDRLEDTIPFMVQGFVDNENKNEIYDLFSFIKEKYSGSIINAAKSLLCDMAAYRNQDEVYILLNKSIAEYSDQINQFLIEVAYGFGRSGDKQKTDAFLKYIRKNYPEKMQNVMAEMTYGLARSHEPVLAFDYIAIIAKDYPNVLPYTLEAIGMGFSTIGSLLTAKELFFKRLKPENENLIQYFWHGLASGLAGYGYKNEAYKILNHVPPHQAEIILNKINMGFLLRKNDDCLYERLIQISKEYPDLCGRVINKIAVFHAKNNDFKKARDFFDRIRLEHYISLQTAMTNAAHSFFVAGHIKSHLSLLQKVYSEHPSMMTGLCRDIALTLFASNTRKKTYVYFLLIQENYPNKLLSILYYFTIIVLQRNNHTEIGEVILSIYTNHPLEYLSLVLNIVIQHFKSDDREGRNAFLESIKIHLPEKFSIILYKIVACFFAENKPAQAYEMLESILQKFPEECPIQLRAIAQYTIANRPFSEAKDFLAYTNKKYTHALEIVLKKMLERALDNQNKSAAYSVLNLVISEYHNYLVTALKVLTEKFTSLGMMTDAYHYLSQYESSSLERFDPSVLHNMAFSLGKSGDKTRCSNFLEMINNKYIKYERAIIFKMFAGLSSADHFTLITVLIGEITLKPASCQAKAWCGISTGHIINGNYNEAFAALKTLQLLDENHLPQAIAGMIHNIPKNKYTGMTYYTFLQKVQQYFPSTVAHASLAILSFAKPNNLLVDKSLFLGALSTVNDDTARSVLFNKIQSLLEKEHASESLLPLAKLHNQSMHVNNINFNQSYLCSQAEIRYMLLQWIVLIDKYPYLKEPFFNIVSFLSPNIPITRTDVLDLSNKLYFKIHKKRFMSQCQKSHSLLTSHGVVSIDQNEFIAEEKNSKKTSSDRQLLTGSNKEINFLVVIGIELVNSRKLIPSILLRIFTFLCPVSKQKALEISNNAVTNLYRFRLFNHLKHNQVLLGAQKSKIKMYDEKGSPLNVGFKYEESDPAFFSDRNTILMKERLRSLYVKRQQLIDTNNQILLPGNRIRNEIYQLSQKPTSDENTLMRQALEEEIKKISAQYEQSGIENQIEEVKYKIKQLEILLLGAPHSDSPYTSAELNLI